MNGPPVTARERELIQRVESSRERFLLAADALGETLEQALNPVAAVRRAPIGSTVAALATGLLFGWRGGSRGERDVPPKVEARPAWSMIAAQIVPAVVPALLSLLSRRRRD